jgi:hypothetical protein
MNMEGDGVGEGVGGATKVVIVVPLVTAAPPPLRIRQRTTVPVAMSVEFMRNVLLVWLGKLTQTAIRSSLSSTYGMSRRYR